MKTTTITTILWVIAYSMMLLCAVDARIDANGYKNIAIDATQTSKDCLRTARESFNIAKKYKHQLDSLQMIINQRP